MKCDELITYMNDFLQVNQFKDYAPNGLQIEGKHEVKRIVTGVSACQGLIDKACELNADLLLVHHGFFWKNESPVIKGIKAKRIKALMAKDINLVGYHLPLDAHVDVGNNAMLAQKFGINKPKVVEGLEQGLIWYGNLSSALSADEFTQHIAQTLQRTPLHIGHNNQKINSIAWCSGGAQDYIEHAINLGVDAFISGEVSERTFHMAMENNIHYFAAGHHATESFGIQALGEHVANKFGLIHQFVDIPNPV